MAGLPISINTMYLGIVRVEKKLKDIIMIAMVPTFGTFVLSYLLIPYLGVLGVGIGWLTSQSIVALVITPKVMKKLGSYESTKSVSMASSYE